MRLIDKPKEALTEGEGSELGQKNKLILWKK